MKKLLMALVVGVLLSVGIPQAEAIRSIVGTQVACDTTFSGCQAIPLTVSILCVPGNGCPQTSQPSLTNPLRFWGATSFPCKTSIDGGTTWVGCTTEAFTTGRASFAGTASGAVIGANSNGTSTCFIRRSTDNAASWTTVFTATGGTANCDSTNGYGSNVRCRADGICILPFENPVDGKCYTYRSADDGITWIPGTGTVCSIIDPTSVAWDGTHGFMGARTHTGATTTWLTNDGSTWTPSAVWPINIFCPGGMIYNGSEYSICNSNPAGTWTLRNSAGGIAATVTFPGAASFVNNGPIEVSIGANIIYAILPTTDAIQQLGVWVSRDAGSTFAQIGKTNTGGANNMNGGDFYFNGLTGCLYASTGQTPMFAKVC